MKIPIFILSLVACSISYADTENKKLEAFKLKVNKALTSRSLESISSLYQWADTSHIIRDQELLAWREIRLRNWNDDTKVTDIKWEPIEDWSDNQLDRHSGLIKGQEINGNTYVSNVPVSGLFRINWTRQEGKGQGYIVMLVGRDESGRYVFASPAIHRKDGKKPK